MGRSSRDSRGRQRRSAVLFVSALAFAVSLFGSGCAKWRVGADCDPPPKMGICAYLEWVRACPTTEECPCLEEFFSEYEAARSEAIDD